MEIKIVKNAKKCFGCEREFVHEESITSRIRIEERTFVREDFCAECWNSDQAAGAYSLWMLRYIDPEIMEQQPPEVFSPLRQVFFEAVQTTDRVQLAKAYLAAQMLKRQKVFRLIKESEATDEGVAVALYLDKHSNQYIEVRDPQLSYDELDAGRIELVNRLRELEETQGTEESTGHVQSTESGHASP